MAAPGFSTRRLAGTTADRPHLRRAIDQLGAGDVLMVTRLDRLARSTRALLNILDTITRKGAGFRLLGDGWADTTTPHGRLTVAVVEGLAEFEGELIRARTGEGRQRAKARGVHIGRPPTLTPHQRIVEAIKALWAGTATQADLARRFAVSQSTISRLANKVAHTLTRPPAPRIDADTEGAARVLSQAHRGKVSFQRRHSVRQLRAGRSQARQRRRHGRSAQGGTCRRAKVAGDMARIAFDVLMETGVMVERMPLGVTSWRAPRPSRIPL